MLGDALLGTLHQLPRVVWLMTTLGSKGAVLLQRAPPDEAAAKEAVLEELLSELHSRAEQARPDEDASPACASHSGVIIRCIALLRFMQHIEHTVVRSHIPV